ncbi:hypothetical protein BDZ89DRAFT_421715 [Hymenopellis radicata]|nr:hypothetical protein BDZ89DRAFT_421715 [Hymenopellis radicata]
MDSQSEPESQRFVPQSDDDKNVFPVVEITAEKGKKYKVRWAGNDPATGKPWAESWEPKTNVMSPLVTDWKARKQAKKDRKRASKASSASTRSKASGSTRSRRSTTVKLEDEDDYEHPPSRKTATMAWQRTKLNSEVERTPSTSRSTSTSRLRKRISTTRQSHVAEKSERDNSPSPNLRRSVIVSEKTPTKSRSVSTPVRSTHSHEHDESVHYEEIVPDDPPPQEPESESEPEIVPRKRKREPSSSPEPPTQESITPEARQRKKRKVERKLKEQLTSLSDESEDVDMDDNASEKLLSNSDLRQVPRSDSHSKLSRLDLVDATSAALEEVEPDLEIVQDSLENVEDSQERREPSPLPPTRTTSKTPRPVPSASHGRRLHPLEEPDLTMLSSADRARLRRHDRDLAAIEEAHTMERTSSAVVTVQSALPANDQGMVVPDSQETRPKKRTRAQTRSPSPRPHSRRSLMKGKSPSKLSVGRSPSIKSMGSVNSHAHGKVLAPIPVVSQSAFRPYLTPKVDDDSIEEFSSPIKPAKPQEADEEEDDVPDEEQEEAEAAPEEEAEVSEPDPVPNESRDSQYYQRKGLELAEEARRKTKGEPVRKRRIEELLNKKREKAEELPTPKDDLPPPGTVSDTDDDQSHLIHYDALESQQDEHPAVEMHPTTEPTPEPELHPPSEPEPQPEPEAEPEPEREPTPEAEPEPEREPTPDPEPEREPTPEPEPQLEPARQPEPDSQETNDNTRTDIDDSGELRKELDLEERVNRRQEEEESSQDLEEEERARKEKEQNQNQPDAESQQSQDTGMGERQQLPVILVYKFPT